MNVCTRMCYLGRSQHMSTAILTLWWFRVVLSKGLVFRNVGVEKAQRVVGDVLCRHHLVGANNVRQRDGRQLLLGVGLHRVKDRLVCVQRVATFHIQSLFFLVSRQTGKHLSQSWSPTGLREPVHSQWMSCSTQVKVIAPSLLLSLNLNRKVPGHLSLSRAFSLSLLMKPMMELYRDKNQKILWQWHFQSKAQTCTSVCSRTRHSRVTAGVS